MAINVNTTVYDKVIDRAAMIRLYERRVNRKIETVVDGHVVRLDDLLAKADTLSPKGRDALFKQIDQEIFDTFREAHNTTSRSLVDLFVDQMSYAYQNIQVAMGKIWETERPAVRLAEDVVLNRPLYKDVTLAAGWAGVSLSEKKRLEATIRKGIADNKSLDEIALLVRKGNIHNITKYQAKGLVVTAVTSVTSQADQAVYQANSKAINGYQYVAVLDSRTTALCASRDGKIYPIDDTSHLPPAHFNCRSTTVPVFKSWSDIADLEGVAQVRRRNLTGLSEKEIAFYDGQTPLRETYNEWLSRQKVDVQLRHLGDYKKVELFNTGQLPLDKFTNPEGNSIGIRELRAMTDSEYTVPNDTIRFANAKAKLDSMQLGATTPEDFIYDKKLEKTLHDYYLLQSNELDGTLSVTNYRGLLIGNKRAMRGRVISMPPREDQLLFNPITGRYEDVRLYQPAPSVLANNIRLVNESEVLLPKDKKFINDFVTSLEDKMSMNERAAVSDNLRIIFSRYRNNKEVWTNFKAVSQSQIKFDVMNVSDAIETQIRRDKDVLKRLLDSNYIDPVLGPLQLDSLHDNLVPNIIAKNYWEDKTAPKIAKELRNVFDNVLRRKVPTIYARLSEGDLQQFYLKFAQRLSLSDTPDRDAFAVSLGRDLYNLANYNGSRNEWYKLGTSLLDSKRVNRFFEVETFGVQKRRMKSRMSGNYFGPYYDALSYNIRVTDPRIQEYAQLTRKVDVGLRLGVLTDKNQLVFRKGYKTYFIDRGILGYEDTRIPITSTTSFSDFPEEFIDNNMVDALTWASKTKYRIDNDYYDFIQKLLYFQDDKGKAEYYSNLNQYRKYIASRSDTYERFKAMEWLRKSEKAFSNHPFIDHRARIYDRGLISPQSGETFRPFLNTAESKAFSPNDFYNLQDQLGSFLGGLNDKFEGRFNSLSNTGRQKIAEKWRPKLVELGNHMLRGKPDDIRFVLSSEIAADVDGEDIGKFYRLAMETAKIDKYLGGNYSPKSLNTLSGYKTALALEQDASSSGAQIIALTTRNKQLAELSNVIPTPYKKRLYDEIASLTYNDPRFREINKKLGLTEKDLRKAAKAQNMVTFYGAGQRTGILNVEGKLSKVLGKDANTLVVTTADRDLVLNEVSARIAKYERFAPDIADELRQLRKDIKDIFDKGLDPGDDIIDQLYFLQPQTRDLVEKMSASYNKIVTPNDFKEIAGIMSEHLAEQAPIFKDFTKFLGRLAEDYLINAKPSNSDFDWKSVSKIAVRGKIIAPNKKLMGSPEKGFITANQKGYKLPLWFSRMFGLKANEPVSEKLLKRFGFWTPNGNLAQILYGVPSPESRRIGGKFFKLDIVTPAAPTLENILKGKVLEERNISQVELFYASKFPKSWTNVPSVNFDGKVIEQNFTQSFQERLLYKTPEGEWITNILQVPQKTTTSWWEELANKSGKINDIADATKARTAYAVNANHSNDAVIVKRFHLWGKANNVPTSTVHDAFFTNIVDMPKGKEALRKIYGDMLEKNVIKLTLDEMLARGFPKPLYDKYLQEAISIGLIPIAGVSKVGGKTLKDSDILKFEDILKTIPRDFKKDYDWYGVG